MKLRSKVFLILTIDLVVVLVGYIFSLWLRLEFSYESIKAYGDFFKLLPPVLMIYLACFILYKVHRVVLSAASIFDLVSIIFSNILATLIIVVIKLFTPWFSSMPGSVVLINFFVTTMLLTVVHFFLRGLTSIKGRINSRKGRGGTVIYGAGSAGRLLIRELIENKDYEYRIRGFVDDNPDFNKREIEGYPVLGDGQCLESIVSKHEIDHVIIAMPSLGNLERQKIVYLVLDAGVKDVSIMSSVALNSSNNLQKSIRKIEIKDLLNRSEIKIDGDKIGGRISDKTILVTGAGGSIGSELVRQIITYSPKRIVLFDINETGLYNIQQELLMNARNGSINLNTELIATIGSIRDAKKLDDLFREECFNLVFHAAAHKHVPLMESAPGEAIKNNIFGTKNLINVSIKYKVETFVNISTDKAVNPTNVMGATKRFIEMMIQSEKCMDAKTKFVAVRFGNVLGSNGSVIPLFQRQIDEGGPVTVTDPNIVRYFMTIPEAVSLVLQASTYALGGEIFVLDMGDPVKIDDLARKMIRLSGYEPDKDIEIIYTGLRPGEKLYEELLMGDEGLRETENNLIHVATPIIWKDSEISAYIDRLSRCVLSNNTKEIKETLESVVETYTVSKVA